MKIFEAAVNKPFQNVLLWLLAPLPLPFLQPLLHRIITKTVQRRPELFDRLGVHKSKRYLIDPLNMPFVFLLFLDPDNLALRAYRRNQNVHHDARIAGTFLTLLDMVDGQIDGDALFFTRDLIVEGDTEAVVVLRNALDNLKGSIADDIASVFGFSARLMLITMRKIRGYNNGR